MTDEKDIVVIIGEAQGYYSGAEYYEAVAITKDFYDKICDIFNDDFEVYVPDLDGKHSEVRMRITFRYFLKDEIKNTGKVSFNEILQCDDYGYYRYLYEKIFDDLPEEFATELDGNMELATNTIFAHCIQDCKVEYVIPAGKKTELDAFVEMLKNN